MSTFITCIKCGETLCHEAELLPAGACLDDEGEAWCVDCWSARCAAIADNYEPTTVQLEALNSGPLRTEDTPSYRAAMIDAGRGAMLR